MSVYGPVHKLIVREVGKQITRYFDADEFEDYEIEHPSECKLVTRTINGPIDLTLPDAELLDPNDTVEATTWQEYECGVIQNIEAAGCRWSLAYSGCLINEPGEYRIQAWAETIRGYDFTEYDGGIGLAEEVPA